MSNPVTENVELDTPLKRGDQEVTSVTLTKPQSGALRGVSLVDLLNMDVIALRKVLPRITNPVISEVEVSRMDPADLVQFGAAITGFLLSKKAKAMAEESQGM